MKTTEIYTKAGAVFSPCRTWRYTLYRLWEGPKPGYVNFIGLNPSTADEKLEDNTVRRCIRYAYAWGYSGCYITNIFGLRGTDPACLYRTPQPGGPMNLKHLVKTALRAELVIAAWGNHGKYLNAGLTVAEILRDEGVSLYCLGETKAGFPCHPLRLPNNVKRVPYLLAGR